MSTSLVELMAVVGLSLVLVCGGVISQVSSATHHAQQKVSGIYQRALHWSAD